MLACFFLVSCYSIIVNGSSKVTQQPIIEQPYEVKSGRASQYRTTELWFELQLGLTVMCFILFLSTTQSELGVILLLR